MNADDLPEFLRSLPGIRRFNRDVVPRLVEGGFTLPRVIFDCIEEFRFEGRLPPLADVLDEVLAERLSARGFAWTWEARERDGLLYRSELLDSLRARWLTGEFSGDPRFVARSSMFLDPRLAAFFAMPYVNLQRWRSLVEKFNAIVRSECESLQCGPFSSHLERGRISRKSISSIVQSIATEMTDDLSVFVEGNSDCYEIDLTAAGSPVTVRGRSGLSSGKVYFDSTISLLESESSKLLLRLPLDMVVSPYGEYYLAQRHQLSDVGVNVAFAWAVFRGISQTAA